jgi:hypothetical protein
VSSTPQAPVAGIAGIAGVAASKAKTPSVSFTPEPTVHHFDPSHAPDQAGPPEGTPRPPSADTNVGGRLNAGTFFDNIQQQPVSFDVDTDALNG